MAKCEICGKSVLFGNNVSHSNKKTSRLWHPNIKKVHVIENGQTKKKDVCTRCIRSGKVVKSVS